MTPESGLGVWLEPQLPGDRFLAGDTLADFGDGPQINSRWLSADVTREQVVDGLRPLLALPVERLLATQGGPFERAALERALS